MPIVQAIFQCIRPQCHFRFPAYELKNPDVIRCPRCGSATRMVENPYPSMEVPNHQTASPLPLLFALLDNIRSAHNVGSIFRTADGAGFSKLFLCGVTPTPDHPKVGKTALGAEYALSWSQYPDSLEAFVEIQTLGCVFWALEGGENSTSLYELLPVQATRPICLILGNEVTGIDPGLLVKCERVVHLPMLGVKHSLNVSIAFGISAYSLRFGKQI